MGHGPRSEPAVTIDIAQGLRLAVQHLKQAGCRRPGYNDLSAIGRHIAARERQLTSPVVGFDGSPLMKAWRPVLPYVDLRSEDIASSAVELLVSLIKDEVPSVRRPLILPVFVPPDR